MAKLNPGVVHQIDAKTFIPGPKSPRPMEHDRLPTGTYLVDFDMEKGLHLVRVDDLGLPEKLYGNTIPRAAKIVQTFKTRPGTTGVLASGIKGSGKTLLVKAVAGLMLAEDVPVLLVNKPFAGDMFAQFLGGLNVPFMAIFDEFEKVYNAENQEKLLTLLDGTFQNKGLFALTCNIHSKVDTNLINRPSRIFYNLNYRGMELDAIQELALDTLKDPKKVEDILKLSAIFDNEMNFDMVQSAIEEINRYPEQPLSELMEMMNLRPSSIGAGQMYTATLTVDGKTYSGDNLYNNRPALSIWTFVQAMFQYREGFSDQEIKARGSKPAAAVAEENVIDMPQLAPQTIDVISPAAWSPKVSAATWPSTTKKKKSGKASTDEGENPRFSLDRLELGDDYETVWSHWREQIAYGYEDYACLKMVTFSSSQLNSSDVKTGTYNFTNKEGHTLQLTRVRQRQLGTSDYFGRL